MALACPQCSHINPEQSGFCVGCGNRLQQTGQFGPPTGSTSLPTYARPGSPAPTKPFYEAPPVPSQNAPTYAAPPAAYPTQMGTGQGLASIRRAFAGHGTLVMHYSWLLQGKHLQATAASSTILDMLRQRSIAGLSIKPEKLIERGVLMEERNYVTVQRGVSTVFIYVGPAGEDLYISRATTVLPAISYARAIFLGFLALLLIFGFTSQQSLATSSYSPYGGGLPFLTLFLAALFYPLLLFFLVFLIRSFMIWLVEKDFWVYLRPNNLNDFQLDDIALLEHVTDNIAHDAMNQLGLDASKIIPPTQGYQPKRRIRAI